MNIFRIFAYVNPFTKRTPFSLSPSAYPKDDTSRIMLVLSMTRMVTCMTRLAITYIGR